MGEVHLREARWTDLATMARVEQEVFPDDAWSEASLWAELAQRPRRRYLVAECSTDAAASVLGYAGLDLAGEVADVMTVVVAPSARGRGLGATLMHALHRGAVEAGARSMMLEVRADNAAALKLYRDEGYETVRTRPGYYRTSTGPSVDALIMRKDLEPDELSGEMNEDDADD